MEKKNYFAPEMEIVLFDDADIIITSRGSGEGDENGDIFGRSMKQDL